MGKLILILTIISTNNATTVEHVPGFSNVETCLSAGRKWGEAVSTSAVAGERFSAVCVSIDDAKFNDKRPPAPTKKKTNL